MGSRVRLVVGVLTTLPLLNNVVQLLTTFTQGPHDFPSPPAFLFFFFTLEKYSIQSSSLLIMWL